MQRGEAGDAERGEVTVREVEELFVQGAYVEVFFFKIVTSILEQNKLT